MEALQCYASDSDSSEPDIDAAEESRKKAKLSNAKTVDVVAFNMAQGIAHSKSASPDASSLPPPPPDLLTASNSLKLSAIARRQLEPLMSKAFSIAPELKPMEMESSSCPTVQARHELPLAKEYHISLSRTVPIRMHQITSIVAMLQNKFEYQKGFWLNLDHWELFVNDEQTRSFLSLEVVGKGLSEICKQIQAVDEVFRLHNLPKYYETPRPHVSVAWALGNAILSLQKAVEELNKNSDHVPLCPHPMKKIECKIGSRTYCIWKEKVQPKAPFQPYG